MIPGLGGLSKAPSAAQGQISTAGCLGLVVLSAVLVAVGITLQPWPGGAVLFPQQEEKWEANVWHWAAEMGGRISTGAPRKQSQSFGADVGALCMRHPHNPPHTLLAETPSQKARG